jgi:Ca2+-binding EF-hand superfamily protein
LKKKYNKHKPRFKKLSANREIIDKAAFQENIGILGISSVEGFSDRLFNSFDTDTDGKV